MPRLSTLSNPTGIKDLDRKLVGIVIDDQGVTPSYSLIRLDLTEVSLPPQTHVVVIARRGNAEIRVDHGAVTEWDKGFVDASELGTEGVWLFRVLLVLPGSPKLLAAIENVRPQGLGNSESLIALEPADDLGHVPWEFNVLELDGRGVIRFNREIYANSAAAEADTRFACLVFPEAIRQLAAWHTHHIGALAEAHWEPFKSWLTMHGVTDEPVDDLPDENDQWCRSVVSAFCARNRFADVLRGQITVGGEE